MGKETEAQAVSETHQPQLVYLPADYLARSNITDDEINLRELFSVIWRGKWVILLVTLLFAVGSAVVALSLPNVYKAEVLLAPMATDDKSGGMAGLAGQFGGLATLAGINLGGNTVDKTTLALEVLKSKAFLTDFVHRRELSVPLIAAKGWDSKSGGWLLDEEVYDAHRQQWVREVQAPKSQSPSDWELYDALRKAVVIERDKQTSMVKIAIESLSPIAAQQWADWLVADINETIRKADILEAERSIEYLRRQLEETRVSEMQQALYQLIEQQTKIAMLAQVRKEYVLKTVDPAVVPEEKAKPNRMLLSLIGGLMGAFIGVLFVVLRNFFSGEAK